MVRKVMCFELRKGDMLEREMPMSISKYIKKCRDKALEIAEKDLAFKYDPIEYEYDENNNKIYCIKEKNKVN